jgi:hypothetical protein
MISSQEQSLPIYKSKSQETEKANGTEKTE